MKKLILILFFFQFSIAHAQDIGSKEKNEFFQTCVPSCLESQKKMPENKIFSDVIFVLEAYCSCTCARMSMRIDRSIANKLIRLGIAGKDIKSDPAIKNLSEESSQKCMNAFF